MHVLRDGSNTNLPRGVNAVGSSKICAVAAGASGLRAPRRPGPADPVPGAAPLPTAAPQLGFRTVSVRVERSTVGIQLSLLDRDLFRQVV